MDFMPKTTATVNEEFDQLVVRWQLARKLICGLSIVAKPSRKAPRRQPNRVFFRKNPSDDDLYSLVVLVGRDRMLKALHRADEGPLDSLVATE